MLRLWSKMALSRIHDSVQDIEIAFFSKQISLGKWYLKRNTHIMHKLSSALQFRNHCLYDVIMKGGEHENK